MNTTQNARLFHLLLAFMLAFSGLRAQEPLPAMPGFSGQTGTSPQWMGEAVQPVHAVPSLFSQSTGATAKMLPGQHADPEQLRVLDSIKQLMYLKMLNGDAAGKTSEGPEGNLKVETLYPAQVSTNFEGNLYDGSAPQDNSIAISNSGWMVTVVNSTISFVDATGFYSMNSMPLDEFFSYLNLPGPYFGATVLYDPLAQKFILACLSGDSPGQSTFIISFSETSDPNGGWWTYDFDSDGINPNLWFNNIQIGVSAEDLYVTGDMYTAADVFNNAVILQMNKENGYAGLNVQVGFWNNVTLPSNGGNAFSIKPVSHGFEAGYGPGILLLASLYAGGSTVALMAVSEDYGNNPSLLKASIPCAAYLPGGNAAQQGSTKLLSVGDCRIRSAFYENGRIHFAHHAEYTSGYNGIRYSVMDVTTFSIVETVTLGLNGYAYAFPAIAPLTDSNSGQLVALSFCRSSATSYPEFRVTTLEGDLISNSVQVKAGATAISTVSGNLQPWGKFTGIGRQHNVPVPTDWVFGAYGKNNAYGNWIAKITPEGWTPPATGCDQAVPLVCNASVTGSTSGLPQAVDDCVEVLNTAPGTWFSIAGTGNSTLVTTCSPLTNFDTKIGVFEGPCSALVCVGGNDDDISCSANTSNSSVVFQSQPGKTYYIYVTGFAQSSGTFELTTVCNLNYCAGNDTLTTCSGHLEDGSGSLNYLDMQDCSWVIAPPNAVSVTFAFSEFNIESGYDFLRIHDGDNSNAPLIGNYTGNTLPPTATAASGKMYIEFTSDFIGTASGWAGDYTCTTPSLSVSPGSLDFTAQGGSNTLNLSAGCIWTIANIPGWLQLSPNAGPGNATINVVCQPNYLQQSRSVTLTVNACNGLTQTVVINQAACTVPQPPVVTAAGPTSLCNGETVTLNVSNVCSGCTVDWSNGQTGNSITVSTAGSYTARFTDLCGQSNQSNAIIVTTGSAPSAPVLSASGATELCSGQSVSLTAGNVCVGCTVNWSNGQTGTSITVSTPGTYSAQTNNSCGQSVASNAITVSAVAAPSVPSISAAGPTELCPGQSVTLSAGNVCSGCTVTWSNGQTGASVAVSAAGTYTAQSVNICGQSAASNAITVTSLPAPTVPSVSAMGATELCPGQSVTLTASNICPNCTVNWSNGQTGASITVSAAGTFTAQSVNICGQSAASNAVTVTTLSAPTVPSVSASGSTELCPGQTVALTASNVCAGCTVNWSNGQTGPSITVSAAGTFTAQSVNSCGQSTASNAITVTTLSAPAAPVISAPGSTNLCPGQTITIVASNICAGCTVVWSNGQTSASIIVASAGTYTAQAVNTCGPGAPSNSVVVTQLPDFVPLVQVTNVCHLSAPAGTDYQWSLDGVDIPGATAQLLTVVDTGFYTVRMKNADGCIGISDPVYVVPCGSGSNELTEQLDIYLYPNPARDRIYLLSNLPESGEGIFELFTADGRFVGRLFEGRVPAGEQLMELTLPMVPDGVYMYKFRMENGSANGVLTIIR